MLDFGYYNMDCMQGMKEFPDKYFDLAIVDPPYGIGVNKMTLGNGKRKVFRGCNNWDETIPTKKYFDELFRVSKNQIVWGGNYFVDYLPPKMGWIFWDKGTGANDFSDGELAWTSFDRALRKFFKSWVGANAKEQDENDRIHPTQKPVALYKWILDNYAKPGDKILDTHVGSASSLIACEDFGFQYVGFEIDADYYKLGQERLERNRAQMTISDLLDDWRFP